MTDIVSPLLEWLNAHPQLAGLVTFLISAGESVALLGTIVPGSIMMTALGTLAGAGVIPLWSTIIWAILGAIVGDGISYWIGHYFKDRLPHQWPFRNHPYLLSSGEKFFHKYGSMSVFIGRFVGPVRALVPLVAGMLGMRPLQFTIANVTSAIGWAPAYMLPGILLGAASLELPPDIAVHVILVLFLIGLFILMCLWFIYKIYCLIQNQLGQLQNNIWLRLKKSRYFSYTTVILKHHNKKKTAGQFSIALIFILIVTLFFLLALYVKCRGPGNILINEIVFHLFRGLSIRSPRLDDLMLIVTFFGQKEILLPALGIFTLWLICLKRIRIALHVIALTILAAGSVYVLKHFLHVARPWGIVFNPEKYSMPSGHTTISACCYMGLALLAGVFIGKKTCWRKLVILSAVVLSFGVAMSRLYLGAHWFTDILAGWLLAAALLIAITISFQRRAEPYLNPIYTITVGLLCVISSVSFYYYVKAPMIRTYYVQTKWPVGHIAMQDWWKCNGYLPTYKSSLFGFPSQQINVEWAGNINQIRALLLREGWVKPPARDFASTLHRIADVSSTQYLPLISPQYLDQKPALILARYHGDKLSLVLRLWFSSRVLTPTGDPLWVGIIGIVPRSYSWLFSQNYNMPTINATLLLANQTASHAWQWKVIDSEQTKTPIILIRPHH
jgi:membrane protein DedA with SNARE-associated domain